MAKTIEIPYKNEVHICTVSDQDLDLVEGYRWRVDQHRYALATVYDENRKRLPNLRMHRLIVGAPSGYVVDHIDGNTLNNQRDNLRICSQSDNLGNSRKKDKKASSQYKGLYWDKKHKKWRVRVTYKKKTIHVGLFKDELEAARAYNTKAIEVFKEYAALNKVEQ